MILTLLKKHWYVVALLLLVAVQSARVGYFSTKLEKAEAERDNIATQLAWSRELLTTQSAAVDSLSKQREEDRKAYLAGIQAANKRAIQLEVSAERILSLPTPIDPANQCTAAEALLRKELTQ